MLTLQHIQEQWEPSGICECTDECSGALGRSREELGAVGEVWEHLGELGVPVSTQEDL